MKYCIEKLTKFYDDSFDLERAEPEANIKEEEKKKEEENKKALISKKKKELADAIDCADKAVDEAYKSYEKAKEECKKILEESNDKMTKILAEAKNKINQAQNEKYEALSKFNKEFGAYKTTYTGEKAEKEFNRIWNNLPKLWPFDSFFIF